MSKQKWSGKTEGWGTGMKIFYTLIKKFGYIPAYVLVVFVSLAYTTTSAKARRVIKDFRLHLGLKTTFFDYYAHVFSYSISLVHRIGVLLLSNNKLKYSVVNENYIKNETANGKGVILLSAHIGNWEIAGEILSSRLKVKLNALMVERDGERMRKTLGIINKNKIATAIIIGENQLETALKVKNALENGEIVAALGDRFIDDNVVEVDFLGEKAKFPRGIFEIACITNTKIIPVFMTRKKMQFYEFRADEAIEITNEIRENRKEIIDDAVQSFADKIAQQARKTPLQWYNYYEFWD